MNLKMMNESFKRKYSNTLIESIDDSDKEQLKKALIMRSMDVIANGGNIKSLEIALQEVIENFYPDHCWWEVTDCQIFNELLAGTKPREVCEMIVDQLKPEFANSNEVIESIEDLKGYEIRKQGNFYKIFDDNDVSLDIDFESEEDAKEYINTISDEDLLESVKEVNYKGYDIVYFDRLCDIYPEDGKSIIDGRCSSIKQAKKFIDDVLINKLKSADEFFDSFEESLIEALKECLNRLNEAQMSDEDKHDSALIKGMIDKIEKRSNARFTPEEQATMTKYGITRNNWNKELSVDGRSLHPNYDGQQRKVYTSHDDWKGHYVQNGDPSKINYADRARKLPKRAADQISGKWTPNGYINAHTRKGQSTLQDVERNTRNAEMQEPVHDMKRHLQDRKWQQEYIDGAQDEYNKSMASAQAEYDRKMKYATDTYKRHTVDATKSRDAAQARIDKMLKRK